MDVSDISSVGSAVSASRQAQAGAEVQVRVQKKQVEQEGEVAATLIESAAETPTSDGSQAGKGRLIGIA